MKKIIYPFFISRNYLVVLFAGAMAMFGTNANAQTYTINFSLNTLPPTSHPDVDQNDHLSAGVPEDAIETGIRFRVTQPGVIKGIRFYKGDGVAGIHIGHLWTNSGTKLAEATFTETANGWQEVPISVHVDPGTNYVASVFSNVGDYAAEQIGSGNWLGSVDYGSNPIKVIASENDPAGNGVYKYLFNATNPTGAFPTEGGTSGVNYWIDVRFRPDFSLPVSLSDFRATTNNSDVLLSWKTGHEFYNKGFEIQRSNNGADWYAVSFVNGVSQSDVTRNYNYTDKNLAPGSYYYRLKQSDLDGKSTFSSIVTATVSGKGIVSLFQNTPNPFITSTSIRFDLPKAQHARLSIVDMSGREVKVLTDKLSEAGSHIVSLSAATLQKQTYIVRLQTENGILTKKILVQ